MKIIIAKHILKYVVKRQCGSTVPRSGEEGEKVNCFHTYLFNENKPYMVITSVSKNEITGKMWAGESFGDEGNLEFKEINKYQVKITHHYGLYDTKYNGLLDYTLTGFTKIDELKCDIHKILNTSKQFVFNKRKLATLDRLEILRALIDLHFSGNGTRFMTMDLMTRLYSLRWILHPNNESQENKLQLFVDSFVESGELEYDGSCYYSVKGKAITTLSKYEERERRHLENKNLQNRMLYLTFAIVLVGIIQAIIAYKK